MIFEDKTGKRGLIIKSCILFTFLIILTSLALYLFELYGYIQLPYFGVTIDYLLQICTFIFISYLIFAIALGFIRMLILFYFVKKQLNRKKIIREYIQTNQRIIQPYRPFVSVIIPIYNEEVVIKRTITSILNCDYPSLEILIIDDGSTDNTASIIDNNFSKCRNVRYIYKENGGKASALNLGIEKTIGDVIVTIDADTIFTNSTINHLVNPFSDPLVAAVSGNCKVGNLKNQLTLWQHIEYVTSNNLDKRGFEEIGSITVVPGSNSAWRKSFLIEAGGFADDTLAEDTDLTFKALEAGYKIIYEDRAFSYEETPENIKDFLKQRFRWSYGIIQVIWKHRQTIIQSNNKALKYFAVPSLLFNYLVLLTIPLADIAFIFAFVHGSLSIFLFVLLFYFIDFLYSYIAFRIEKENLRPLCWVFVQRIAYRMLLTYITWKTLIEIVNGSRQGWNKVNKTGNNFFK